jgi:hypothetical protein
MATFYVMPSRQLVGQRYADFLTSLFPDARFAPSEWLDLADSLAGAIAGQGRYVVHREELDDEMSVRDALLRDFGADLDDDIIEVRFGPGLCQFVHERWAKESLQKAA